MAAHDASSSSLCAPHGDRHGGRLQKIVPTLAPLMPCVLVAWLTLASVPLGGPGERAVIWLGALAIPLAVLLWIGAGLMLVDRAAYPSRRAGFVTVILTLTAWGNFVFLGFLLPDLIDGQNRSLLLAALDSDAVGLTAGFANTVGVLTFVAAGGAVLSAALDLRATRAQLRGEVVELSVEDEDRLRQEWVNSFR